MREIKTSLLYIIPKYSESSNNFVMRELYIKMIVNVPIPIEAAQGYQESDSILDAGECSASMVICL